MMTDLQAFVVGVFVFIIYPNISLFIEMHYLRSEEEEKRRKGTKILKIHCFIISMIASLLLLMVFMDKSAVKIVSGGMFWLYLVYLYHAFPSIGTKGVKRSDLYENSEARVFAKKVLLVWVVVMCIVWSYVYFF
jgi:amino acid transporter